jgi:DNA sulfur modification protein DndD
MNFSEIKIKNFMPYREEQTVSFPSVEGKNVLVIFGDNMGGKTCFLNAVRWVFYDKALGRRLDPIPRRDLINREAAQDGDFELEVSLIFSSNGDTYELKRTLEPVDLVNDPKSDDQFSMKCYMKKNGAVIREDLIAAEINTLLPEQVSRFFLFDAELLQEYEELVIRDSDVGEKIKERIEQVLGVPTVVHGRNLLETLSRKVLSQYVKAAKDVRGNELIIKQFSEVEEQLRIKVEDRDENQKMFNNTQGDIDGIEEFLKTHRQMIAQQKELEVVQKNLKEANEDKKKLGEKKLERLKSGWLEILVPTIDQLVDKLDRQLADLEIETLQEYEKKAEIAYLKHTVEEPQCRICEQEIDDSRREVLTRRLQFLESVSDKPNLDKSQLTNIRSRKEQFSKLTKGEGKGELTYIEREMAKIEIKITEMESQAKDLRNQLTSHNTAEMSKKQKLRDDLQKNLGTLATTLQKDAEEIKSLEKKLETLSKTIKSGRKSAADKINEKKKLLEAVTNIFSDGVEDLRDRLRSDVNEHASQAFKALTTDKDYSGLSINDNYGLMILDSDGKTVQQRSAGAEHVVALSLIDGLNKVSEKHAPIIMDTPFGRLDPKHRENILRYLPTMASQVVLLVHEGELTDDDLNPIGGKLASTYKIEHRSSYLSDIVPR